MTSKRSSTNTQGHTITLLRLLERGESVSRGLPLACWKSAALALCLLLPHHVWADQAPVLIDVGTSTGNDTLFVGEPGLINFSLDANGNEVQNMAWAYFMIFTGSNWIGVLSDGNDANPLNSVEPTAFGTGAFTIHAFDNFYGANPTNPDTLVYTMLNFGGPFTSSGDVFRLRITPSAAGSVTIQPVGTPIGLPGTSFGAQDPNGADLPDNSTTTTIWSVVKTTPPHPVLIDVTTSTGNDTLFVGEPASIIFSLNANGNQVQGVEWAYFLNFTGGNWMGVLSDASDGNPLNNVAASALAVSAFNTQAFNNAFGANPSSPDTLLFGMASIGAPFMSSAELFRLNVTPSAPGSVSFQPAKPPLFLPGTSFGVQDPNGDDLPENSTAKTIYSIVNPIQSECNGALVEFCPKGPGPYYTGSGIVAHATAAIPAESLLSFRFLGFRRNGVPAIPDSLPQVRAFGGTPVGLSPDMVVLWYPAQSETGTWEFCFETVTTLHDTLRCCADIFLVNPLPDHVQWASAILEFTEPAVFQATLELQITTSPDSTQLLLVPLVFQTASGSAYLAQRLDSLDFLYPPEFDVFDIQAVNNFSMNAFGSPDSLLLGYFDGFSQFPGIPPATHSVQVLADILPLQGIIQIDTSFLPPSNFMEFITVVGTGYREIIPTYGGGCFPVLQAIPPPAIPPPMCFGFGCIEDVLTGSTVCIPLNISNVDPCQELGGFDLLFTYDASVLAFQGLDLTGSVLEAAGWEYLTYRIVSTNPALIRIVAIADMNNSAQHPSSLCLDGLIANVCFKVTHDQNAGCQSAHIQWYWQDCGDNTASDPTGNILYIITDPNGGIPYAGGDPVNGVNGGGIIHNSCDIEAQFATFEGGINGPADFPCPNPDTTKPQPVQGLCFINGKIKIICPGDIDDGGDINLNGFSYEIADAVLFANYFILGPSVFTISAAGQTAATDINADGTPLTVADLVYLLRIISGDALPIDRDLLGGGPKLAVGQLQVTSSQQGANVTVSAQSDADLGAGLFVFDYSGSDIAGVSAVGRASDMNVMWNAQAGQLRVLMLSRLSGGPADQRQMVAAGNGPILDITTHGATVELESVEAATFMGGELETQLEAKVLPTSFALKQNFPNPFNPSTSLAIDFPKASDYKLTIYNVVGQTVRAFSGNTEAGTVTLTWDGRDARGSQVATGVYFYSVEAGNFRDTKRMLLLR